MFVRAAMADILSGTRANTIIIITATPLKHQDQRTSILTLALESLRGLPLLPGRSAQGREVPIHMREAEAFFLGVEAKMANCDSALDDRRLYPRTIHNACSIFTGFFGISRYRIVYAQSNLRL